MLLPDLLKTTRQFFWQQNFTEVEVNYLNSSLPLEQNLYTFKVNDWYLPASPEFKLKEFLATNPQNCFSIAHCFRNLEATSPYHSPEFLMLEYYLVNQNLDQLIDFTKKYISFFLNLKFEIYTLPTELPDNEPDFNQYFLNEIEPKLPKDKAIFVTGYPAFLSPLAKVYDDANNFQDRKPRRNEPEDRQNWFASQKAKRFELYINGIEIANGCEENRDPVSIKKSFESEQKYRQQNNLPTHPYSQEFINYCAQIPPSSGIGLGLNRLLSIINL